jgi:hypothetical protein
VGYTSVARQSVSVRRTSVATLTASNTVTSWAQSIRRLVVTATRLEPFYYTSHADSSR